ncbi:hypothetical protein ACWEO4_03035 [Streptomyces sp. NPDC004393]|uniref:hypothetical protein n=1 Tax=Streptomyces sp. NPDC002573 TaxID=3364651 RepID=UPI00368B674A
MYGELGNVILAGVAHNNPNYDPGWKGFFSALVVIAGGALILAGVTAGFTTWRRAEQPREKGLWRVLLATTGCFGVVGLAIIAVGVWLS